MAQSRNMEDLEKLQKQKDKAEKQLRYYKDREKIMAHQVKQLTRKERTNRLCTRAGMLESFLQRPGDLTNDQVMELLKIAFRQEAVVLALNQMLEEIWKKERYHEDETS